MPTYAEAHDQIVQKQTMAQRRDSLRNLLDSIWRMGDRDECSVKHVNHALAAIVAGKTWRDGHDYNTPWSSSDEKSDADWSRLDGLWARVRDMIDSSPDDFVEMAIGVPICSFYLTSYLLEWAPPEYQWFKTEGVPWQWLSLINTIQMSGRITPSQRSFALEMLKDVR